jgi:acetaldehyde dehydrogenase (acetylating)
MILFGGRGHSVIVHTGDDKIALAFGLEKPVFRIGVNTMGTLGTIGLTTKVMPSMTLGSGGIGGAITGDNITVYHLFNIKRLAYETTPPPEAAMRPGTVPAGPLSAPDANQLEKLVQDVVQQILRS